MGRPQALTIQLGHLTGESLEPPPSLDAISYRLRQRLRHVIARGLTFLAPEADVEVRPVLLPLLAAALRLAAGAIGLGHRSEDRPLGQTRQLA